MRTFTAQFRLPGNFGIGQIDPDSMAQQKQLSLALANNFIEGKAKLTHVAESGAHFNQRPAHKSDTAAEWSTMVTISLCLNDNVGANFKKHQSLITQKAADTLRNGTMFLSYLLQQKNSAHIGLETIFV